MNADFFEHGGNLAATMRQHGIPLERLLDFSANINPLGLPESVRLALEASLGSVIHYPDSEAIALKEAISHRYGIDQQLITIGNGASELIYVLCHMLRPRRVLVLAPTFSEYERAARAAGAVVEYSFLDPAKGFAVDGRRLMEQLASVDMVFLCNPNNPTGQTLSRDLLAEIISAAAKHKVFVIVDESFLEFLPDGALRSCRDLVPGAPHLIILQSLTKFYAIPGLRLGFMLADPDICKLADQGKDAWNVNTLAQIAGVAALNDESYRALSLSAIPEAREVFFTKLGQVPGFVPLTSSANFIFIDIGASGYSSGQLRQALIGHGILIRDCSNYPGLSPEYIRLAVKLPSQNEQLLAALQEFFKGGDLI